MLIYQISMFFHPCVRFRQELSSGSLRFNFSDLLDERTRGETAQRWIETMHIHGVAVVSGVPWVVLSVCGKP